MSQGKKKHVLPGTKKPTFSNVVKENKDFEKEFLIAFNYAHYNISNKDLKANAVQWVKKNLDLNHANIAANPDWAFATIGKVCYILNNNGDVTDDASKYLTEHFPILAQKGAAIIAIKAEKSAESDEKVAAKPTKTIQDRLKDNVNNACGELEGWVDDFIRAPAKFDVSNYNPYDTLKLAGLKPAHSSHVKTIYEKEMGEIEMAISGKESDIKEAYSHYTKPQLKKLLKLYESFIMAAERIKDEKKATRAVRKKPISTDKLVSKLKYSKGNSELGLASIAPVSIIGASALWIYNSKTRKIGCYVAIDGGPGLGIKGSTIVGFSESKSIEKTIRKPNEFMKQFKKTTPKRRLKLFDEVKTIDTKLNGRVNDNHVLVAVER